ncbi:G-type lectin S-receptor-like serine threonine-kinase At5g35370 [Olea europaea subsp. europaea]|uniref:Receptor-like serine/threonine-protein kinase n=1 Tax=Olea europaea subsp. europaea TaxID=158383 RepID=A0A8S0UXH9_OLEEU|nr:G-type lectin S-receptor-like serine threonine-kinase At5g35370 [Olea europaea subsp. europaea]
MASSLYTTTTTTTTTTISLFLLYSALLPYPTLSGRVFNHSITPNFTASFLQFVDHSGAFLASKSGSFQARITNSKQESQSYYLVIIHVLSNTIVWSANRNTPISESSELRFSPDGLTLYNETGHSIWSTPSKKRPSSVSSLQLLESGNLIMVDGMNKTVWESFDSPTDVIVMGQELLVGKSLVSSVNEEDLSEGSYRFVIGENDAILQWNRMTYYKLSMDTKAFRDTSLAVEYMVMNFTGMYLMGSNGTVVVIRVILHNSNAVTDDSSTFRILKLDPNGVFSIVKIDATDRSQTPEFMGPADICRVPSICRRLNVCTNGGICQCAPGFHSDPIMKNGDCVPADNSLDLPDSCDGSLSSNGTAVKYMSMRDNLDYFSNDFMDPILRNVTVSVCQDLCSRNCSCLGIFHSQDSGSCYAIQNYLGSLMMKSNPARDKDRLGYIKAIVVGNPNGNSEDKKSNFPVLAMVLLPSLGVLLIAMVPTIIWLRRRRRRRKWARNVNKKTGRANSSSSAEGEFEFSAIPGLPVRFNYDELVVATEDFKTRIGSGGFGTVYKGTLQDGADVAVKKITCLGAQGKREFLSEIGIIGKIHHVNLVRLKGFCTHGGQKFLVFEYMNRGSLDRSLFGNDGPALEWQERYEIALGTARGLAYLHTGCEHKILHCDVKPENILLHDKLQVKISDFGLSKLLSPEESGLFTTLRGTRGYLAPEWLTSSAISDRTDVYSYGMVLLEILRGKKNSSAQTRSNNISGNNINTGDNRSSSSSGESGHRLIYFPLYALEMHEEGRYSELVDPRLGGKVRMEEVEKLVRVALCCVQEEPSLRPSMSNVVGMLEGILPLGEPRIESLNFLRFYGRRFTEASRLEENNEQNEVILYRQPLGNSSTTGSYNSFSYMSSHQLSGPR